MMVFFQDSKEFSEPRVGDVSLGVWGVREVTPVPASPVSFLQDALSQNPFSRLFFSLRSIYQAKKKTSLILPKVLEFSPGGRG